MCIVLLDLNTGVNYFQICGIFEKVSELFEPTYTDIKFKIEFQKK